MEVSPKKVAKVNGRGNLKGNGGKKNCDDVISPERNGNLVTYKGVTTYCLSELGHDIGRIKD
jgi:hypothetical protein